MRRSIFFQTLKNSLMWVYFVGTKSDWCSALVYTVTCHNGNWFTIIYTWSRAILFTLFSRYELVPHVKNDALFINVLAILKSEGLNPLFQVSSFIIWHNTVEYPNNAVQFITISYTLLRWEQQIINQTSNSQQTSHTSPSRASYVSFMIISKTIDRVITAPHCISKTFRHFECSKFQNLKHPVKVLLTL